MSVCLVTGGAGFIGSHLVEALVAQNHKVRVLDNFATGKMSNLDAVIDDLEVVDGDVTDLEVVSKAMQNVELVFHYAALCPSMTKTNDSLQIHHVGTTGTLHVLQAAHEAQVQRVIFAGSSIIYRSDDHLARKETDPTTTRSLYSIAKLTAEDYCVAFGHMYGLETIRLRFFNVFGPRLTPDNPNGGDLARLLLNMQSGRRPLLLGDGTQTRDYTYINDVVQANLLAADAPRVSGKAYNIGTGQPTSLLDLVGMINQALGTSLSPLYDPAPLDGPKDLFADIVQAQTELGFCPCTNLARDLKSCLADLPNESNDADLRLRWDQRTSVLKKGHTPNGTGVPLKSQV
jgi:UDP-glucose 4-epimerase